MALWIDGKHLDGQQLVVCLGLKADGRKKALGILEATTGAAGPSKAYPESHRTRTALRRRATFGALTEALGLAKAIDEVFGSFAQLQRCQ